ncbi:MAG: hypothetical protein H8E44_42890 [Planctomycetes bacterium]|nr:hypothetical protein [Planctomycetota bacterium]MBL7037647.1 hypothetical protein [Pirellulaceae bacterium]
MYRPYLLCVLVIGCTVACSARSALAQRNGRYQPSRPTTSPYLNLGRTDSGVVDNYNAFVRPEQEMRDAMRLQQNAIRTQGTDLSLLEQRMSPGRRGVSRPASRASVFMNYLHYYPRPNTLMSRGTIGRR